MVLGLGLMFFLGVSSGFPDLGRKTGVPKAFLSAGQNFFASGT